MNTPSGQQSTEGHQIKGRVLWLSLGITSSALCILAYLLYIQPTGEQYTSSTKGWVLIAGLVFFVCALWFTTVGILQILDEAEVKTKHKHNYRVLLEELTRLDKNRTIHFVTKDNTVQIEGFYIRVQITQDIRVVTFLDQYGCSIYIGDPEMNSSSVNKILIWHLKVASRLVRNAINELSKE